MKKYYLDVKYIVLMLLAVTVMPFLWKATVNEVLMFRLGMLGLNVTIFVALAYHYWLTVLKWRKW